MDRPEILFDIRHRDQSRPSRGYELRGYRSFDGDGYTITGQVYGIGGGDGGNYDAEDYLREHADLVERPYWKVYPSKDSTAAKSRLSGDGMEIIFDSESGQFFAYYNDPRVPSRVMQTFNDYLARS